MKQFGRCVRAVFWLWASSSLFVLHAQQASGSDVSSAIAVTVDQPLKLIGDRVTRPHVVYSIALTANKLFSIKLTRLPGWTSSGYATVSRLSLYAPGIQTVQQYNQFLATAEVGDYNGASLLNYQVAVSGKYYLDIQFFNSGISLQAESSLRDLAATRPSGSDVSSATVIPIGQSSYLIGDLVTKPHAVYAVTLVANQMFSVKMTRLPPWTSAGFDTVARLSLYSPGIQTVQKYNQFLVTAEVGDSATTGVLNYNVAVGGRYYLDVQFFRPGVSLQCELVSQ